MPFSFLGDKILMRDLSFPLFQNSRVNDLDQWAVVIDMVILPRLDLPRLKSSTLSSISRGVSASAWAAREAFWDKIKVITKQNNPVIIGRTRKSVIRL